MAVRRIRTVLLAEAICERSYLYGIRFSATRTFILVETSTIQVGGRRVECVVVHYSDKDFTRPNPNMKEETSLWIDPVTLTMIKKESHSQLRMGFGNLYRQMGQCSIRR